MSKARNIAALSTVEVGATADQTKADLNAIGVSGGRKNLIINGGFDVWQRGTSLAAASSYLADRWVNGSTETQSRQTFTAGQTDVAGCPTYYHRGGGGSNAYYGLDHKIENVGTLSGKEVTLSYWMKGSSAFTNAPYRGQNFGSGGSNGVEAALSTASITTSWARYTHTFTLPSISGKTVGASSYTQVNVFRAQIANIVVDIANVQLELGSVATDFEHRSYGEELLLCQRYYYEVPLTGVDGGYGYKGGNASAYSFNSTGTFAVKMRTTPSSVVSGGTLNGCSALSVNVSKDGYITRVAPSGTGSYRAYEQKITFSAEL